MNIRKLAISIIILGALAIVPANNTKAATVVSETEENGTKVYVIAPGGAENDFDVMNRCLHSNGDNGVRLTLQGGAYSIYATLHIYDNTSIIATGATISQTTNGKGFLVNARHKDSMYGEGKGGYTSCKNISVDGGTWVGTVNPDTSKAKKGNGYYVGYSGFMFMHGQNITIQNASFKNNYNGHFIEFAGVKNGIIKNCNMDVKGSKYVGESSNEAVQIDNTYAQANSPIGSPWDDTPCKNVTVEKCKIRFARGIGTNRIGNSFFENLQLIDNTIVATKGEGFNAYDIKGLVVKGNTITSKCRKKNYESTGMYLGLDTKITKWGNIKTVIEKNNITGYSSGLKIVAFHGAKFGKITIRNNTLKANQNISYALTIPYNGKQIQKLTKSKNKLK